MAIEYLFVIATLLSGSLTGILSYIVKVTRRCPKHCAALSLNLPFRCCTVAQDDHIRNFQVVSQTNTHIIFSWDIVDSYYNSSYIYSFRLYYRHRSSIQSLNIPYSSATRSGATFRYTSSVINFNNGPYVMWVRVYRSSALDPWYTDSRRKYVSIGKYIDYLNYVVR